MASDFVYIIEYNFYLKITSLYCDNRLVVYLAHNPTFHKRIKHIEIDSHLICDKIKLMCRLLIFSQNGSSRKTIDITFTSFSNLAILIDMVQLVEEYIDYIVTYIVTYITILLC